MGRKHTHNTLFWCPYMVSVQCNGGLPPDIILLTLCDSIGEPFQYHIEFLSLQPVFPPKPNWKVQMCSDFSLNKSAVRTKNCSLNMPADQHNFMGKDGSRTKNAQRLENEIVSTQIPTSQSTRERND